MIQSAANKKSGIIATCLSIVILLITASGVFGELQTSLNAIWEADPSEHSTDAAHEGPRPEPRPCRDPRLPDVDDAGDQRCHYVLFGAVYKVLPDKTLEWRDVFIGSVFTAALYTIGKTVIALYIGSSSVASYYGQASALVVLLLWVYYSALTFLLGAEFTKVYARRHGSQAPRSLGKHFWNLSSPI